jgi:predicted sugar kinase
VRHLLPAALEQRFDEFAEALWEYGSLVGDYFAPVQGGRFANRRLAELVPRVRELGFPGIAQTSWGPALAVACASEAAGRELQTQLQKKAPDVATTLAQPSNRGVL